jgi:uncharacterized membrane protein YkvA (DUF1232 family)
MLKRLTSWARHIKQDVVAVNFAARDPRTPMLVSVLALLVAAYALSPIDLIPDFIPVVGYLDDLILVPLGLWAVIRWLPPEVLAASRVRASVLLARPRSRLAAVCFVLLWLVAGAWLVRHAGALGWFSVG